jgi:quinol monooxygenase YgiN
VIIVRGSARVCPDAKRALIDAAIAVVAATKPDDGCVVYEFSLDLVDEQVFRSVEVWRDQAALDKHMDHEHTKTFLRLAGALVDGEPKMEFLNWT